MLISTLFQLVFSILTAIFSFLPRVTTLPTIMGVDVDGFLSTAVGSFYSLSNSIWPLRDLFLAGVVWLGYLFIKMLLKIFLGSRAPS